MADPVVLSLVSKAKKPDEEEATVWPRIAKTLEDKVIQDAIVIYCENATWYYLNSNMELNELLGQLELVKHDMLERAE
jgi:hypothetical protein